MTQLANPQMKLLLIVPHPDDEVYGASGTLMDLIEAGFAVGLVTLTRGEAGRMLGLCETREELARLREAELRECLDVIGVQVHEHLNFPDKALAEEPLDDLVEAARSAMQRHKPETVLTFAPNGSNGHPDHVTTHRAVKAAWDSLPESERPQLWYYAAVSPPENEELLAGWSAPNLRRDVSRHITRKLQAIACHRSQALSTVDFIRKFPERITQETFYVVGD